MYTCDFIGHDKITLETNIIFSVLEIANETF